MIGSALERKLIEEWLPLRETNVNSIIEKSFKQARARYKRQFKETFKIDVEALGINTPLVTNMHTWFARRPCCAARVLTLAGVMPVGTRYETFNKMSGFNDIKTLVKNHQLPIIYNITPKREYIHRFFKEKMKKNNFTVVDPMAGGGVFLLRL